MSELREYMMSRLAVLEPQEKELLSRLVSIQSEMAELRRALRAVQVKGRAGRRSEHGPSENSIQGQALSVLTERLSGMTATDILERIRDGFGRDIRRESLAPQLSRLCADGRLLNEHGVYRVVATQENRS